MSSKKPARPRTSVPSHSTLRAQLEQLALNTWSTWDRDAVALWRSLERASGGSLAAPERSPTRLLQRLGARATAILAGDPALGALLRTVSKKLSGEAGAARAPAGLDPKRPIAYFSMEFGVHETLAVYAGGLGILAGDHAKSSSDEAVPLIGVGLFYHNGYFRQELDARGRQKVVYPRADLASLPLEPVRSASGKEVRIPVEFPDRVVKLKLWRLQVGRVPLLLLDSDIPENRKEDRLITYRLYGGSREDRIRQEVVAGIGGVRALRAAGHNPGVWHLNEGHVAFLTLERLREVREELGLNAAEALEVVAGDTVFTTHTPVPEGNEAFDLALARRYLERHAEAAGIPVDEYLELGLDQGRDGRPFLSMTVLALRLSRFRNGVSALHGQVSRKMWSKLWPGFRAEETPITSVTNGVHTSTWVAPEMANLLDRHVGKGWERHLDDASYWNRASKLPEAEVFSIKQTLKARLVAFVRRREVERLERCGWSAARARAHADGLLDPGIFTIGFARRFALYKRSALLFRDFERARKLLTSRSRPVQIIFSGKPHPEDTQGKAVFEQVAALAARPELQGRVVLLENYDIEVAQALVQGVDLWLNNPRRPLEASGTSGQKVPINGGLNCSILDGWWCEGYAPDTGWAFGRPIDYADEELQDEEDAESLLTTLEREVVPLYYDRDRRGLPLRWLRRVKSSIPSLVPRFSTSHMVLEYSRRLYKPALENGRRLRAGDARLARELARWKETVQRAWPLVHTRRVERKGARGVIVEVFLGGIPPGDMVSRVGTGADQAPRKIRELGPGLHELHFDLPAGKAPRGLPPVLRLYPTHPQLVHPHELGIAIEVALG